MIRSTVPKQVSKPCTKLCSCATVLVDPCRLLSSTTFYTAFVYRSDFRKNKICNCYRLLSCHFSVHVRNIASRFRFLKVTQVLEKLPAITVITAAPSVKTAKLI